MFFYVSDAKRKTNIKNLLFPTYSFLLLMMSFIRPIENTDPYMKKKTANIISFTFLSLPQTARDRFNFISMKSDATKNRPKTIRRASASIEYCYLESLCSMRMCHKKPSKNPQLDHSYMKLMRKKLYTNSFHHNLLLLLSYLGNINYEKYLENKPRYSSVLCFTPFAGQLRPV